MPTRRQAIALLAVCLLALAVRFASAGEVYRPEGTRLLFDTDPHYHVHQVERLLRGAPGAPWFDPELDWPHGAEVPWPPAFDLLLAGAVGLVHGPQASVEQIAQVAVAVPPFLGALSVALLALLLAALLGPGPWALAALLLALLPAHVQVTQVGRPDQHALEMVVAPALWLAFTLAWRSLGGGRRLATGALSLLTALAFWTWPGSGFVLAVPALAVAALHLAGDPSARAAARALALGAGGGAALLLGSIAALGAPGALQASSIGGLGGVHVAIAAGCAVFAGVLSRPLASHPGPSARAGSVALALLVAALATLLPSPAVREAARRGLDAFTAAGPWYSTIAEFRPLVGGRHRPLLEEPGRLLAGLGLLPLLALAALPGLRRRWRDEVGARGPLLALASWLLLTGATAEAHVRFLPYATLLLVAPAALGLAALGRRVAERARWPGGRAAWLGPPLATALLAAAALAPAAPRLFREEGQLGEPLQALIGYLGTLPPRPDGRDGVAADWDVGHAVLLYGRKPVLASPFGTEAGPTSLPDLAGFVLAGSDQAAEAVLARRRIGYLLVGDPLASAVKLQGFAPPDAPRVVSSTRSLWDGPLDHPLPGINRLPLTRLFLIDGTASPDGDPPLPAYRLLHEVPTAQGFALKLFGVVPAARLQVFGARPGEEVVARLEVRLDDGRRFEYADAAAAGADGRAILRIPYATGPNGTSLAGPVRVSDGRRAAVVRLEEAAVLLGREVAVALPEGPP